jgi:hypothetical protein
MFLGLPDPDPLGKCMDPDPDPSIIKQKSKKNLDSYCFVTLFGHFIFEKNDVNVHSKSNKQKNCFIKVPFFGGLKVNDENNRILIRIHTKISWIRNTSLSLWKFLTKCRVKFNST